ncbi:hypothetical protein V6N13_057920 [Hibiscus sabdariffa]
MEWRWIRFCQLCQVFNQRWTEQIYRYKDLTHMFNFSIETEDGSFSSMPIEQRRKKSSFHFCSVIFF